MIGLALRHESRLIIDNFAVVVVVFGRRCGTMSSAPNRVSSGKKKSAVPDRWEKYVPYGKPIANCRFIAFKVPLRPHVAVPERDGTLFTPVNMLKAFEKERIDVGLIVDLTFTTKYYDRDVSRDLFGGRGIAYHKIFTEGHDIPKAHHVRNFQNVVAEFLDRDPRRLVGVHCTHGLNRTGYMVCRYLIERLGWNPDEAIAAFNQARGHVQERQNYLDDLRGLTSGGGGGGGGGRGSDDGNGAVSNGAPPELASDVRSENGTLAPPGRDHSAAVAAPRRGGVWDRLGPATVDIRSRQLNGELPASIPRSNGDHFRRDPEYHSRQRQEQHSSGFGYHAADRRLDDSVAHAMERRRPYDRHHPHARHHPYAHRSSSNPVFQPYQRLDPHRIDHRGRTEDNGPSRHSRGANGNSSSNRYRH